MNEDEGPVLIPILGDLECNSCEHGPCPMKRREKVIKILGMPHVCPYGLEVYADFTAIIKGFE